MENIRRTIDDTYLFYYIRISTLLTIYNILEQICFNLKRLDDVINYSMLSIRFSPKFHFIVRLFDRFRSVWLIALYVRLHNACNVDNARLAFRIVLQTRVFMGLGIVVYFIIVFHTFDEISSRRVLSKIYVLLTQLFEREPPDPSNE